MLVVVNAVKGGSRGRSDFFVPGQLLVLVAAVVFSSSSVCWFLFWWCWRALGVLLLALVRLIARASGKH